MSDKSQRTEKPTPKKLEKARKEGQFPVSRDFVNAVQFFIFILLLSWYGREWLANLASTTRVVMSRGFHVELTPESLRELLYLMTTRMVTPLVLAGAALVLAGLAAHLTVTRLGFSFKKLTPDFKRLSPAKNLSNLRRQNLTQFVQALILLPVFSLAVYDVARDNYPAFLQLPFQSIDSGLQRVSSSVSDLLWKGGYVLMIWGAVDLTRQKRRFQKEMSMSKQEIREEAKESEGSPQVKQKIRRIQRDAARRRMMSEVPTATAVIDNPTPFAVAIRYRVDSMATPVVVAKGKNYLALRIRRKALEHGVPIVENPPLAQGLYKAVDVGQEIPASFYRAVAEILAYIYKLRGGK